MNPFTDFNALQNTLYRISPNCRDAINRKDYFVKLLDGSVANDEQKTSTLLDIILDEMEEFGIISLVETTELFADWYTTAQVLIVLEYLYPEKISEIIGTDPTVKPVLQGLIENLDEDDSLVFEYLNLLASDTVFSRDCNYGANHLLDKLTNNTRFVSYFKNVIDISMTHKPNLNPEAQKLFFAKVESFKSIVDKILSLTDFNQIEKDTVVNNFQKGVRQLIQEDIYEEALWFFTVDQASLSVTEKFSWYKTYKTLTTNTCIGTEYYKYASMEISPDTDLNTIDVRPILFHTFIWMYLVSQSLEKFTELYIETSTRYTNSSTRGLFTENDIVSSLIMSTYKKYQPYYEMIMKGL